MSSLLNTKRTSKIYQKLIKKTTDTKLQRILAVNKKNLILANITTSGVRQERSRTERWRLKVDSVGELTTMSDKLFQVLITRLEKKYLAASIIILPARRSAANCRTPLLLSDSGTDIPTDVRPFHRLSSVYIQCGLRQ